MAKINKKGVFLTLGMVLLAIVIFSLALTYFRFIQSSEERFLEITLTDKLYDIDNSIQKGVKELFINSSRITLSSTPTSVTFEENLPNSATTFNTLLENYKSFVEGQEPAVTINTTLLMQELPIIILPHNITYIHKNFGGRQIEIIPNTMNFDNYTLYMQLTVNITTCTWNTHFGNLSLTIRAIGTSANDCADQQSVNPSEENIVKINNVTVTVKEGGKMIIANNGSQILLRTTISSAKMPQENFALAFPAEAFTINFSDFGMIKKSKIRLL